MSWKKNTTRAGLRWKKARRGGPTPTSSKSQAAGHEDSGRVVRARLRALCLDARIEAEHATLDLTLDHTEKVAARINKIAKIIEQIEQYASEDADHAPAQGSSAHRDEVDWRRSQKDRHDESVTVPVRQRDGDNCRFCGVVVNWYDRKGTQGGVYSHVTGTPGGTPSSYVVACRTCANAYTDASAALLHPVPTTPAYSARTVEWLTRRGVDVSNIAYLPLTTLRVTYTR